MKLFKEFLVAGKVGNAADLCRFLNFSYLRLAVRLTEQLQVVEILPNLRFKLKLREHEKRREEAENGETEELDTADLNNFEVMKISQHFRPATDDAKFDESGTVNAKHSAKSTFSD